MNSKWEARGCFGGDGGFTSKAVHRRHMPPSAWEREGVDGEVGGGGGHTGGGGSIEAATSPRRRSTT